MQHISNTSASRTVIYSQRIAVPVPVALSPNSRCVGGHNNPVVQVSAYSGHLYCSTCLDLKNNINTLRCECCNAVVGSSTQSTFINAVPITRPHPQQLAEYRCTFCRNNWVRSKTDEDFKTCEQLARSWFRFFLEWGSQTATLSPPLRWTTLNSNIQMNLVDLDTMVASSGHVVGVTSSDEYNNGTFIHYISILDHLRKLQLAVVMVHELTHCWQEENGVTSQVLKSHALFEGFPEWVSYKFLLWLWETSQVNTTKLEIQGLAALKCQDTSDYGTGLREWLLFERYIDVAHFWLKAIGKFSA